MGLELNYLEGQSALTEEEKEGLKIKSISTHEELDEFENRFNRLMLHFTRYNNIDANIQYYIINNYVNSLEEAIIIINDNSNLNTKFNITVNSSYKISGPFTPNVDFTGPMILTI